MALKQHHIICTQTVELEFHQQKENLFLQERIASVIKDRLVPAMDNLFDEEASNKHIKIDELEIDLGDINGGNWEDIFVDETIRKLRGKLNEIVSFTNDGETYEVNYAGDRPRVKQAKNSETQLQPLIHFIRHGVLPWNMQSADIHSLMDAVIRQSAEKNRDEELKSLLLDGVLVSENTFERFLLQFPAELVLLFFKSLPGLQDFPLVVIKIKEAISIINFSAIEKKALPYLLLLLQSNDEAIVAQSQKITRQLIFFRYEYEEAEKKFLTIQQVAEKYLTAQVMEQVNDMLIEISEKKIDKTEFGNKAEKDVKKEKDQFSERIYFIENAGLVILHPFLQPLFSSLEYFHEKNFITNELHRKAVLLSQFLVTGETEIPEHHLLLNKIICGYPTDKPVDFFLELSEKEIYETEDLLQSILKYWNALKTTSVNGLRHSFLQREGKLTDMNDYWLLQVEQKTHDILMNYLPWGISIIKLPWMQERLVVEWNS